MASKKEQTIGALLGAGIVGYIAYSKARKKGYSNQRTVGSVVKSATLGCLGGFIISELVGSPRDTSLYALLSDNKDILYIGITYNDRVMRRKQEHIKSGKVFNEMQVLSKNVREDSLRKEEHLIKEHKPYYNKQHNS